MKREDLEHIIRAVSGITNRYEVYIFGSQSILGEYPSPPVELTFSMEADVYAPGLEIKQDEKLADLIDGAIGEGSPFHDMYHYYAQGVTLETVKLPDGWRDRLVKVQNRNTDSFVGYCLEPHDLAASKLYANREKDRDFICIMVRNGMISESVMSERIDLMPIENLKKTEMRYAFERIAQDVCQAMK